MRRGFLEKDNKKGGGKTNKKKTNKNVNKDVRPKARQLTYEFEVWHLTCVI